MPNQSACILFFVRYPVAGMVKTRLAKSIGYEEATRLYASFVQRLMRGLTNVALKMGAILRIVYDAKSVNFALAASKYIQSKQIFLQNWLGPYSYVEQSNGDIGERMESAMQEAFDDGFECVILLGSDIPDFPMEHVAAALDALKSFPTVINPTEDGGYCLIGMMRESFPMLARDLFHDIPWSTEDVFAKTMERFPSTHSAYILPTWYDVDTVEDLAKIREE